MVSGGRIRQAFAALVLAIMAGQSAAGDAGDLVRQAAQARAVAERCPAASVNAAVIRAQAFALGLPADALDGEGPNVAIIGAEILAARAGLAGHDQAQACATGLVLFGPNGTALRDALIFR